MTSHKKIDSATPEQWQQIEKIKNYWINRQTEHINFENAKSVIIEMWQLMGKGKPIVLQAESPIIAAQWLIYLKLLCGNNVNSQINSQLSSQLRSQLSSQLDSQLDSQLRSRLRSQLYSQLSSQLYSQLSSQLNSQLDSQLYSQLDSQLDSQLYSQLYSQLDSQLDSQLNSQLDSQLRSRLASQFSEIIYYVSIWWQAWSGWYEGARVLGVEFDSAKYNLFRKWCEYCPIVFPYENLCVVIQNPVEVKWDDNLLHCNDGPSVRYSDGCSMWSIQGVRVDEQIVLHPDTQTIDQINEERNEEARRVRIDRFGWMRYLEESKSKVIDCGKNDVEQTYEILADTPIGQRLITHCPSTGRRYSLGIPGNKVSTCEEAQQRLWGDRNVYIIGRT